MSQEYQHTGESAKGKKMLSEKDLNNLEWARDFMNKYERRKKNVQRS